MTAPQQSKITEEQWLTDIFARYKTNPEEVLFELLLNTNDTMNGFLKDTRSEEAFALLVTACTMNNRFLVEAEKQKHIVIEVIN